VLALVAACGLGIALDRDARAQDNKAANANQNQDKGREETITIRGVVAEVTAEDELAIDDQAKQAVLVEATYLTIVEMPKDGQGDAPKRGDAGRTLPLPRLSPTGTSARWVVAPAGDPASGPCPRPAALPRNRYSEAASATISAVRTASSWRKYGWPGRSHPRARRTWR
jgi:hypothetical protein